MPVSHVIETLASGMVANQQRQDVISHNLANINANGYKKDIAVQRSFASALTSAETRNAPRTDLHHKIYHTSSTFAVPTYTHEVTTSFEQGDPRVTDNTFDVALMGNGFFTVETDQGAQYTRNGSFMLNNRNELVTARGEKVLGEGGADGEGFPITIDGESVSFREDGTVQVDGVAVGRMKIVSFGDEAKLKKRGNTLFTYHGAPAEITPAASVNVRQGYLEGSNVNSISQMTTMLTNTKQYELAGKSIKQVEQTLSRAIMELGKAK